MTLFPVVITVIVIVVFIVKHLFKRNRIFSDLGIEGPPPLPIIGNLGSMRNKMYHEAIQEWTKHYGKTFGFYEGGTPILVSSDLNFLHEVFIKRFSTFGARKEFPIQPDPDTGTKIHMFLARGIRWKRLRAISNPAFTSLKMRQMSPSINDAMDIFMEMVDNRHSDGQPFDIYLMYQCLTLDVIARCAFGFVTECQRKPNDQFLRLCQEIFVETLKPGPIVYTAVLFPEIRPVWCKLALMTDRIRGVPFRFLEDKIENVLHMRRNSAKKSENSGPYDFLRLLLEAETSEKEIQLLCEASEENNDTITAGKLPKKLGKDEIIAMCILFMLAGYETTSTALAFVTYLLATNQDKQDKLIEEIDQVFQNSSELPNYENVSKLPYLEMVLHESLRLYPVATPVQARTCLEFCSIGGVPIPAGMQVAADVWTIHYDPDIWGPDPDKFIPERFEPELQKTRHPVAWLPFGVGPRNCIGMRFALMEKKIALCRILRNHRFVTNSKTQIPLKLQEGATTTPAGGVFISLEKR